MEARHRAVRGATYGVWTFRVRGRMVGFEPFEPKVAIQCFARRVRVSIPVFFECDPSIIYGVFDTLWAAGKVWDTVQGGVPEGGLFEPRLVAAQPGPLELITGVSIVPQDTVDALRRPMWCSCRT